MSKSLVPDWNAHTEGGDSLPAPEVTETNVSGLYDVTLTAAARPDEGRIASGLQHGHPTHQ